VLDQLADHDRAVEPGILDDEPRRPSDRPAHDVDAAALIVVLAFHAHERLGGAQQGNAAARQDALLDRRASGVERVVDAIEVKEKKDRDDFYA
jgi:hypothetical protein